MSSKQKYYSTVNTCTRIPSPAQICSYVVVSSQTIIFYLMIRPNLSSQIASIILTVLFSITLAILIVTTFICSYVDPSDPIMMQYKKQNAKKIQQSTTDLLYCESCISYVTLQARHCKQCNRCVENFDHHCMWINNCVGSKNYRVFMVMIISTCLNLLLYIISIVIVSIEQQWSNFMGFMITGWTVLVIVGVLWFLLLNLNILHFYLISKGYTTYQFIMARRQEERKIQLEKAEQQAKKRQERIKKAIEQSKKRVFESFEGDNKGSNQHFEKEKQKYLSHLGSRHQQTGSKVKIHVKPGQVSELQATGELIKNKHRYSTEKNNVFLNEFTENDHHQNKQDQKSQVESHHIDIQYQKKDSMEIKKQNIEDFVESSSQNESQSIRISKFFTRNKSLSLLISSQVAQKPHNISLVEGEFKKNINTTKNHSSVHNPKNQEKKRKIVPKNTKQSK